MTPLTLELARRTLSEAYDLPDEQDLLRCRVNFFEAAFIGLPPGGLAMVRQDMTGRIHHEWIPTAEISEAAPVKKRGKPALRFEAGGVLWQIDRMQKGGLARVQDHIEVSAAAPPARPDTVPMPELTPAAPAPALKRSTPTPPPPLTQRTSPRARPTVSRPAPADSGTLPSVQEGGSMDPVTSLLTELAGAEDQAPVLHRLFHQCLTMHQSDRALLAAQALVALQKAEPQQIRHADAYRTARLLKPQEPLSEGAWRHLLPLGRADAALMGVAEVLAPPLIRMTARSAKDYGLPARSPEADHLVFGRVFAVVKNALMLAEIEYHPMMETEGGLLFANLAVGRRWAPTLVVGTDLLSGLTEPELAFLIAREMTYLKLPHLLRVLAPDLSQQAVLVLTAVAMTDPSQPIAGEQEKAIKTQLAHLSAHMELDDFERVGVAVRKMLSQTEPFDLPRWNAAVDRAALRAGLVLAGDVEVACKMLPIALSDAAAPRDTLLASLIRFAVSDAHQEIRRELGLAIADT